MKITKLGHCCLLIESLNVKILTDPGFFSESKMTELSDLNYILITHEHGDHLHVESLKVLLQNNPNAKILTNQSVGNILEKESLKYEIFELETDLNGLNLKTFDSPHANVYPTIPNVENTAMIFDNRLLYSGDSWFYPDTPIEILAIPTVAPWLKLSESIDYAIKINPKKVFPVHDALLVNPQMMHGALKNILGEKGIEFISLNEGDSQEL